eukprot:scaffold14675_cov73-Cylindrotheca_fusiformis.AAC.2
MVLGDVKETATTTVIVRETWYAFREAQTMLCQVALTEGMIVRCDGQSPWRPTILPISLLLDDQSIAKASSTA